MFSTMQSGAVKNTLEQLRYTIKSVTIQKRGQLFTIDNQDFPVLVTANDK